MKSISIYRANALLLLLILTGVILHFGKTFLVPLFFSILLAMLLRPVCNKLENWGVGRVMSTFIGIFLILIFVGAVIGVVAAQGASIADDWPQMQSKITELIKTVQQFIESNYGISIGEQQQYAVKGMKKVSDSGGQAFTTFMSGFMNILTSFVLVLLYFFFWMWKREKYQEFFLKLVDAENRPQVEKEISEITEVAAQYLVARLISMAFLAVFYMLGFSIFGLENAILISLVAVLPTIIPYVGAFIGGFFPLAMALIGGSPEIILPVAIVLIVAQVIDNNIIEPLVEGHSLDISPVFTIIAIVLGELVWGVAGMVLFIPMFAILKIICDHIPRLHPYSFLLENEMEEPKWVQKLQKFFTKNK
ncbi:MAG: AI-2E family transporter [Flavobacterium sp.]|nr:AI-2E family transporter [Flavobacterium sp.]